MHYRGELLFLGLRFPAGCQALFWSPSGALCLSALSRERVGLHMHLLALCRNADRLSGCSGSHMLTSSLSSARDGCCPSLVLSPQERLGGGASILNMPLQRPWSLAALLKPQEMSPWPSPGLTPVGNGPAPCPGPFCLCPAHEMHNMSVYSRRVFLEWPVPAQFTSQRPAGVCEESQDAAYVLTATFEDESRAGIKSFWTSCFSTHACPWWSVEFRHDAVPPSSFFYLAGGSLGMSVLHVSWGAGGVDLRVFPSHAQPPAEASVDICGGPPCARHYTESLIYNVLKSWHYPTWWAFLLNTGCVVTWAQKFKPRGLLRVGEKERRETAQQQSQAYFWKPAEGSPVGLEPTFLCIGLVIYLHG